MPLPPTPAPRYASHRLRSGGLFARHVLVEALPDGHFRLSPFSEEGERTIFLSGEMILSFPQLPASAEEAPEEVSITMLQAAISLLSEGELSYLGKRLLPLPQE